MTGKANGVRGEPMVRLVDWSTVPGIGEGLAGPVALTGVDDPEAAMRAAAALTARRGGEGEGCGCARLDDGRRDAAFDAALEQVNASDMLARARERRREALRVSPVRAQKPADQVDAERRAERRAIRKGARAAETRTSQPARPVRADAFANLASRGSLPELCVRAGLDIDRIMTAVEAGVLAISDPDTLMTGGVKVSGRRGAPQFMAVEGYCDRYLPWTRRLLQPDYRRAGLPGRAVLAVVIAVVRDGRSPRELDREAGCRNGTCMGLLCDGLREYGRVARWTGGHEGG